MSEKSWGGAPGFINVAPLGLKNPGGFPGAVPQALLMSEKSWGGAPGFINVAPLGLGLPGATPLEN